MRRPDHDEWWIPRPILLVREALANLISDTTLRDAFLWATKPLEEQAPTCAREVIFYLYRDLSKAVMILQEKLPEDEQLLQQLVMAGTLDYRDFLTEEEESPVLREGRIENPNPTTGVAKVVWCGWCPFQLVVEEQCTGPFYHSCCQREIKRRYNEACMKQKERERNVSKP